MKRVLPAAVLAGLLAAAGAVGAKAQSQLGAAPYSGSQDNNVIAVPPAPAIVAAPPAPVSPPPPPTPVPPGLVQASPPAAADDGNADNGSADNGDTGMPAQPAPGPAPDQSPGTNPAGAAAGTPAPGQPDTAQNQPPDQDVIPAPPNTWQPGKFAKIGVLDKVDGGAKEISIPVGGQSVVGDLQVSVLACVTRPPDQVPDAAAFLALQNTGNLSAPPDYRGWLIRSEPGAAVAGDASETFRVIDCPQE